MPCASRKLEMLYKPVAKIIIFISLKPAIYFLSIATLTAPSFSPILNIAVIYPRFPALLKPAACPPQIPVSITKYCRCSIFHIHSIIPFPFPPFHLHSASTPPHLTILHLNALTGSAGGGKYEKKKGAESGFWLCVLAPITCNDDRL